MPKSEYNRLLTGVPASGREDSARDEFLTSRPVSTTCPHAFLNHHQFITHKGQNPLQQFPAATP